MSPRTPLAAMAAWVVMFTVASGQETPPAHDALAVARAKAELENQRILLLLTSGDDAADRALQESLSGRGGLGRLLRYEYQVAAQPASSPAGRALRRRFGLAESALPTVAVVTAREELLGHLGGASVTDDLKSLLERHECEPLDARSVLGAQLKVAKDAGKHVLLYLSAPW